MASGPVFIFCASELVFEGIEGVGSCFHILRSHTHFVPYRGRRVPFTCFAFPDFFSAVPRASNSFFIFFASERVFGGTEGVGSRFHVLRSKTWLGLYRGRRVPFSCFVLPDSLSTVPRACGPIFMFYALGIVWGRTKGGESRFKVLSSMSRFHILRS
jgi:hypothetical protein